MGTGKKMEWRPGEIRLRNLSLPSPHEKWFSTIPLPHIPLPANFKKLPSEPILSHHSRITTCGVPGLIYMPQQCRLRRRFTPNNVSERGIYSASFAQWTCSRNEFCVPKRMGKMPMARWGFTLVELLVVIAIIGILASLSLVVISRVKVHASIAEAKREINALKNAITEYHSDTGRYPVSDAVVKMAGTGDFTYDGTVMNNSEVIAVLMDRERYMDGTPTINLGHLKNTKQKIYLSSVPMADSANYPGLGPDLVFRDPWGNPYIISFDLNYDGNCRDTTYCNSKVSQDQGASGFNGLLNTSDTNGASDDFQYHGGVMVWSRGPDRNADTNSPANVSPNRDNVLSWK
jgi:prepilin-type N-terminal cleavage/methylation domain-containing protein